MSADLSKVRFDPIRNHSNVGCQQGRMWLDADFNEYTAITDRRLRAQVADLQPNPAVVSRLTPDAFKITLAGGVMSIGAGRMYVDGLLAENHGEAREFEPLLAELNGSDPVNYEDQQFWPTLEGRLPANGSFLVYLDVWERELTYLNTPDLVECAVGVDTTTRTQTAWQVRTMGLAAAAGCDAAITKWDELLVPSSARLTTSTIAIAPVDDPCVIPPGGGYRGLENQLYRVELHSDTEFKWSRDNATVGSVVSEVVSASELRLQTLGRDEVLRIADQNWVEIIDDDLELSHAVGEMRQVTVHEDTRTITFATPLPAALADAATADERHLRVRKWDSGLATITPGVPQTLEHGLQVTFSFEAAGAPRAGDYWVFTARSAAPSPEESWEKLDKSPPRGIHHHFTRLAMITLPGTVTDCRPTWDQPAGGEGCACQICVTPNRHNDGSFTLQDAVDQLARSGGGNMTLCPGTYNLGEPLRVVDTSSIRIRGCGAQSEVHCGDTAIILIACRDIVLEDFAVTTHAGAATIVFHERTEECRLTRLRVTSVEASAIAMRGRHDRPEISHCQISAHTFGLTVTDPDPLLTRGLTIRDNNFDCRLRAIDLSIERDAVLVHDGTTLIADNTITGCSEIAVIANGLVAPPGDLRIERTIDISGNTIEAAGTAIVAGPNVRITNNTITAIQRAAQQHGIVIEASPPDTSGDTAHVLANTVSGVSGDAIRVTAPINSLTVADNTVHGAGGGIAVTVRGLNTTVAIAGNIIRELKPTPEEVLIAAAAPDPMVCGIIVTGAMTTSINGNIVDGVAASLEDSALVCVGIALRACGKALVAANSVSRIGNSDHVRNAFGIAAAAWRTTLSVTDNNVFGGIGPDPIVRNWTALRLHSDDDPILGVTGAKVAGGKLVIMPGLTFFSPEAIGQVHVNGNTLSGAGRSPVVIATIDGDLIMTSNHCSQPKREHLTVALLGAKSAVVQGNRLFGGEPSAIINTAGDSAAVLGNIATGPIQVNTDPDVVGQPPTPLNIGA
ncbi:DUF6519 domain-containing protein [Mycobacterium sp. C3-094]